MARQPRVTPAFENSRRRLGVLGGSSEAKAIANSVRVLCDADQLPFFRDTEVLLPPALWAWLHPIPRTTLSLLYLFDDSTLTMISLRRRTESEPG